jgi:hypothetical protein
MANQQQNEPNSPIKAGNMGQQSGQNLGQKSGQNLGQKSGQNLGQKPAQNPGPNTGKSGASGQKGGADMQHGQGGVETQPVRADK